MCRPHPKWGSHKDPRKWGSLGDILEAADSKSTLKIQAIFMCFLWFTFCWILSHLCTRAQLRGWPGVCDWMGSSLISREPGIYLPNHNWQPQSARAVGRPDFLPLGFSLKPTRLPRVGAAYCPRSRAEELLHTSGSSLLGAGRGEWEQP